MQPFFQTLCENRNLFLISRRYGNNGLFDNNRSFSTIVTCGASVSGAVKKFISGSITDTIFDEGVSASLCCFNSLMSNCAVARRLVADAFDSYSSCNLLISEPVLSMDHVILNITGDAKPNFAKPIMANIAAINLLSFY